MIYVLKAIGTQKWKVGYSLSDDMRRIRKLQTASPHKLEVYRTFDGDRCTEKRIHHQLSSFRLEGGREWFEVSQEQLDHVLAGGQLKQRPKQNRRAPLLIIEEQRRKIEELRRTNAALSEAHPEELLARQDAQIVYLRSLLMDVLTGKELRELQEAAGLLIPKKEQKATWGKTSWLSGLIQWAKAAP